MYYYLGNYMNKIKILIIILSCIIINKSNAEVAKIGNKYYINDQLIPTVKNIEESSPQSRFINEAASRGLFDLVKQGIEENNIAVDTKDKNGLTPLMISSFGGYLGIVEYLLLKGAKINEVDNWGNTALHYAVLGGQLEIIRYLTQKKININKTNQLKETALIKAVKSKKEEEAILLIRLKAKIDIEDEQKQSVKSIAKKFKLNKILLEIQGKNN